MQIGLSSFGFGKVEKKDSNSESTKTNATNDKQAKSSLSNTDSLAIKKKESEPAFTSNHKMLNRVGQMFNTIDADKNGFLSRKELVEKMNDQNVKGQDAAIVGSLVKYEGSIKKLSNDEKMFESGISSKDMLAAEKKIEKDGLTSKFENEIVYKNSKIAAVKDLRNADGTLKAPTKVSDINYKDLQQGQNGNCYFLAALTSIAYNDPQKVLDMIKDNKDGTFTVKFPLKSITVKSPTDTELGLYAKGKTWVPIIEKAYAEYRNGILDFDNPHQASGRGTLIIGRSILEMTGRPFDSDFTKIRPVSQIREKLVEAVDNKKIVVASIEKGIFKKNDLNLPDGHVYTVLGYDKKTDMVTIRNPWGSGEPTKDGKVLDGTNDGI
ncbi:MAG: C2 family cysteine protease, partial [Candidatus Sericytochromatia bacterium]